MKRPFQLTALVVTITAIAALAVSVFAGDAFAQNRGARFFGPSAERPAIQPNAEREARPGMFNRFQKMLEIRQLKSDLNLSDEQKEQLKVLRDQNKDLMKLLVEAVLNDKDALEASVKAGDEDAIRAAADELGDSIAEAAVNLSKAIAEAKTILSEEQFVLIQEFRESKKQERAERKEAMRGFFEQFQGMMFDE